MISILLWTLVILWVIATMGLGVYALVAGFDGDWHLGGGATLLFSLSVATLIYTGNESGIFDEEIPPNGCYRIVHDTDYIPTGKTVIPVDDVQFIPMGCGLG